MATSSSYKINVKLTSFVTYARLYSTELAARKVQTQIKKQYPNRYHTYLSYSSVKQAYTIVLADLKDSDRLYKYLASRKIRPTAPRHQIPDHFVP